MYYGSGTVDRNAIADAIWDKFLIQKRSGQEKEIWRTKCGQLDTSTGGGRWRRQHKTELDGDKWSVAYVPPGATRHKSSQVTVKDSQGATRIVGTVWQFSKCRHIVLTIEQYMFLSSDVSWRSHAQSRIRYYSVIPCCVATLRRRHFEERMSYETLSSD